MTRIALLDDYQHVAASAADWRTLDAEVQSFHDHLTDEKALVARLGGFDIVVAMRERTPFPRALLRQLPNLKLLVTTGMRNASIDINAAIECGITVCGTSGEPHATAELTWALILGLLRHVPAEDAATRAGDWQVSVGTGVAGKTLGVLGLGRLGSQVARVGSAFGMRVIAWSQNLTADKALAAGATLVTQDALLQESDVLSIHLVLSQRTRGLLGGSELARMKKTAVLINTSRGPIVDESALIDALTTGAIAGAGLDVYDVEPLPPAHALRSLPNTLVTPHIGYVTQETYALFYGGALEAIDAYLAGSPVRVLAAAVR
jgi:phosphoglycerate dehydrogenase-like enzyme